MRQIFFAMLGLFLCGAVYAAPCDVGQYLNNGVCSNCVYNATCDGVNYKCDDGFYDTGANECASCPINSVCSGPTEFSCKPGAYLAGGVCSACPANATCAGGDAQPACLPGFYRDKKNNCLSCAGHVCDGDKMVCCGAGFYLHGLGQCLPCGATYYCPTDQCVVGITCDTGAYKDTNGICPSCDAGYYCPRGYSTSRNNHDYCDVGYRRVGNICEKCPDGITCVGTYPENMVCPDGTYVHDDGQCLAWAGDCSTDANNCNDGCYSNGDTCVKCPVENSLCQSDTSFVCMVGFYKNGNKCDICPNNSTCPVGSIQIICNDGYRLNGAVCDNCGDDGYWCSNNVRHACPKYQDGIISLPAGHMVTNYGTYTYATQNAKSVSQCSIWVSVDAPQGSYNKWYERYDTTNSQYLSSSDPQWQSVNVGYYLSGSVVEFSGIYYSIAASCTNAPSHAIYTGAGSPDGNDCPWRCDDGYMRDGDTCTMCPAGYTCINGMIACPAGQYASDKQCLPCPEFYDGRSPDNIAPQSVNQCQIRCDGGTYLANANDAHCTNVGAGYWVSENYTNYGDAGVRNQCPDNLTTVGFGAGADSNTDCGRILHVGNYQIYLRSGKTTVPSLAVQIGNRILYGDMSPEERGHMRVEYAGKVYSVFNADVD